ncbi:hypothetical protein PMIN04_010511 [Paraphaeosphaeria minitans]
MPILSRFNAPKLLRSVNNRPHASEDDHEDAPRKANREGRSGPQTKSDADVDMDVLANPISSSDGEEGAVGRPPPPPPSTSRRRNEALPTASVSQGSNASAWKGKRGKGKGKGKAMRAPQRGTFRAGIEHKDSLGEEKENSQEAGEEMDTVYFGMGDTPKKKVKTKNVHAAPLGFNKKLFGKSKPSNAFSIPKTRDVKHIDNLDNALSNIIDDHEKYVEVSDDDDLSPPPKKRRRTIQRLPPGYGISSNPTAKDSQTSVFSSPLTPKKRARTIQRLPPGYATSSNPTTKDSQTSAPSSPLTSVSSHLGDDDHTSAHTIAFSPKPVPDSKCALCQDPVDASEQRDFWAAHPTHTVRDQMLFCKAHKRSKAQRAYTACGFPAIDWAVLPSRICRLHDDLVAILRNETPKESVYRQIHAKRLGSGKAAALPSKRRGRKDASEVMEKGLKERIDATSSSTGYYGPRGKRVMMDVITSDLSDEIRQVAPKDPVVGRSGFAMFLQAVLVPECAVLLVMQDLGVGWEGAREVVEGSGGVGEKVNEEVEDEVEGSEDDGAEEEDRESEHDEDDGKGEY